MQYILLETFSSCKHRKFNWKSFDIFLIFAQNIDCGEAVVTSTHNVCFGPKTRKLLYPCIPQFCYIEMGFNGVYMSWTCFPGVGI